MNNKTYMKFMYCMLICYMIFPCNTDNISGTLLRVFLCDTLPSSDKFEEITHGSKLTCFTKASRDAEKLHVTFKKVTSYLKCHGLSKSSFISKKSRGTAKTDSAYSIDFKKIKRTSFVSILTILTI